jgi:16S rRNA G966 N2-methylase RsmD
VRADVARFLATAESSYDLVFLDPPYKMVESLRMRLAGDLPRVLAPQGVVAYESAAGDVPDLPLVPRMTRRYGATQITIFDAGGADGE